MTDSLHVGQTIELKDGRQAIIRFLGTTHFAAGDWVGVELDDASGKNDGSVQGERYFDCDTAHGMFLREAGIARIVEQQQSKAPAKPNARANGQVGHSAQGRPSSGVVNGLKRLSTIDPGNKRQSMNIASPTPGARGISASSGLRVNSFPLQSLLPNLLPQLPRAVQVHVQRHRQSLEEAVLPRP
ncbi:MAG: hypothetical protein Q9157_003032 [Trypethelium eluteriae]